MSQNTCPICGKPLDDANAKILDNGSPAHPQCAEDEQKHHEEKERGSK